jgi:amino acid transporter
LIAWIIGWDLILEYAVGAAAVSIGWSGYIVDFLKSTFGITLPQALTASPFSGGIINLPAFLIILLITALLVLGTAVLTGIVKYTHLDVASPVSHALILLGMNAAGSIIAVGAIWIFPFHRL